MEHARRPILAGNWKMFKTSGEARRFVDGLSSHVGSVAGLADLVICPPFTAIAAVGDALGSASVALGAQDVYWEVQGAYTGEISPPMLVDLGCRYVIVGHSERRQLFGETDETVNRKVKAVLAHGMNVILCVGETLGERRAGATESAVLAQVRAGLAGISSDQTAGIVLAYEPIWAIGTGENATGEDANHVIRGIRSAVVEIAGPSVAEQIRIQYGGSVKPGNIAEFAEQPDIDGALIGGASLEPDSFIQMAQTWIGRRS